MSSQYTISRLAKEIIATIPVNETKGTFIKEAEERILKTVELPVFRKNVTGSATGSNTYLSMPTDFLAPYTKVGWAFAVLVPLK